MTTILDTIVAQKLIEVRNRKSLVSLDEAIEMAGNAPDTRGFKQSLYDRIVKKAPAVIAEVKKASPSRGVIREHFVPKEIAIQYQNAGAACLSVLTDEQFFQGCDQYLVEAKQACELPVLRKDFIIDEYQIHEARALGADCVLLIVSILDDKQLRTYHDLALSLGLNVLVEVHNEEELRRTLGWQADILGVNNRNLKTFDVSLQTTIELQKMLPADAIIITESGIHSKADVEMMRDSGIYGFLVGEAFMRDPDPGEKLKSLFSFG